MMKLMWFLVGLRLYLQSTFFGALLGVYWYFIGSMGPMKYQTCTNDVPMQTRPKP
ncbi:hypothetical protein [Saccharicrinis aurantiacus]|uniref:hypothetical protein n=1 Tax=Saccharicrinis aurantiacus TaxID=1849719 RepID=UPI0024903D5C|nr:hypothetical protein [Saccharicrinis aurantiacus]